MIVLLVGVEGLFYLVKHGRNPRIAAGLERAFAIRGFAEPSVEDLRDAAGVSLRTLDKYAPSCAEMVLVALQHRHRRYIARVFGGGLPGTPGAALEAVMARAGAWVATETSHGCLFRGADPIMAAAR